jgi:hypothetical protein
MLTSAKTRAEEQFAATQKKAERVLKEMEQTHLDKVDHVAKLRALRLAKEAADKEAAAKKK